MAKFVLLFLAALSLSSCTSAEDDEHFSPYPGGKSSEKPAK